MYFALGANVGANKSIFIILGLQTALLLFLSYRVISLDQQVNQPVNTASSTTSTSYTPPPVISSASRANEFVRRDDIRAVMREEMDAIADKIIEALDDRPQEEAQMLATAMDPRELAGLKASVSGQINSFFGQGIITPTQLGALEQSISRLPPRERIKALGELNRAINNGQIEARF